MLQSLQPTDGQEISCCYVTRRLISVFT